MVGTFLIVVVLAGILSVAALIASLIWILGELILFALELVIDILRDVFGRRSHRS